MSNITPDYIRGFIVPFRLTADHWWSDESTMTQNGELAGIPVSNNNSPLVITSSGPQSRSIEIETKRAGHIQDGAGFVWRYDGDALFYGQEPPNKMMDIKTIQTPLINESYVVRSTIRLSSGTILASVEYTTATTNRTKVYRIDVDGVVSNVQLDNVDSSTLMSNKRYPSLVELPNGDINLGVWIIDDKKEVANIKIFQSLDDGQSWDVVSSKALPTDVDVSGTFGSGANGVELQPIVMASNAHQVLLLAAYNTHNTSLTYGARVAQYASTNGGLTFKYVDALEDTDATQFYLPQVVEYNGVFIIGYIESSDSLGFTRLTNAFDSIFDKLGLIPASNLSGSFASGTANRLTGGDWAMTLDTDGRIYLHIVQLSKLQIQGGYTDLAGVSVEEYADKWNLYANANNLNNSRIIEWSTPTHVGGGFENVKSVAGQGEILIFGQWNNIGTNSQALGIHMITLGGWSTQQYPRLEPYTIDNQWGYDLNSWSAFDLPQQNSLWTRTVSGTPVEALGGDHISLTAAASELVKYSQGVSDKTNGAILHTKISNVSGGSVSRGTAFGIQIQEPSTTNTYHVEIVVGSNRIHVYDVHAGYTTPLASATGLTLTDYQILVYVDNGSGDVFVYYGESGSPRQYQLLYGRLTTDPNTTQQIYWGIPTAHVAQSQCDFHFFSYSLGDPVGLGWVDGDVNVKQYSSRGFETQIKDGLTISTLDGPAREGDTYQVDPQYGSPIQRTLHIVSPSPHVGWRSDSVANPDTTTVGAQFIAWMLDTTLKGTAVTHTQSQAIGIHMTGVNFKEFSIEIHNGSTWSKVATVDNTVGGGFSFTRQGASIVSTAANGPYLHLNECDGWSILLDDGVSNVVQRRVQSNGDGVLATTSSKRAYLTIEGVQSTDPTSGTAYLIPSSVSVILNENEMTGFRIGISNQKTYEGYFEIGTMVAGPLMIMGPQYGRGRTIQVEANVIEDITPNGTLYAQSRGKNGRVVRIAWTDGVDTSALNANQANPDYYELYTGDPIAANGTAPTSMMGLVQYVKGGQNAIVYLPNIEASPVSHITLNRYHNQILTTMGSDVQIDHVVGDELLDGSRGEVFRISTVNLREVR